MHRNALFICRFQPFHLGHMSSLQFALKNARHVIIGIGSAQERYTDSNPLDFEDRALIIRSVLASKGIKRCSILEIPDFKTDEEWYGHIRKAIGKVDFVISSNVWVRDVFEGHGVRVVKPPMFRRNEISGTIIREKIRNGGAWKELVDPAAAGLIEDKMGMPSK